MRVIIVIANSDSVRSSQGVSTSVSSASAISLGTKVSVCSCRLVTDWSKLVISELQTSFQMGFLLFLPFLVIDFIVSSVLMALGMMMMPPVSISLPLKLLLFVLVDGWHLVVRSLVQSFVT